MCRSLNSCSCLHAGSWSPTIDPPWCWSTVRSFCLCLMCFSVVPLQAKPIYGGWLLLAPEGTDFDNPVHRSRVSEAEMPFPCAGGGRRSGEGLSLLPEAAAALGVPQAPPGTHPLVQTGKPGDVACSRALMPSPGALQVLVRLSPCSFIACCCCFLMP